MEVTINVKNWSDFEMLLPLLERLDISLKRGSQKKINKKDVSVEIKLPITFAEKPDFMSLAGIWKNQNKTLDQVRNSAWGERL